MSLVERKLVIGDPLQEDASVIIARPVDLEEGSDTQAAVFMWACMAIPLCETARGDPGELRPADATAAVGAAAGLQH